MGTGADRPMGSQLAVAVMVAVYGLAGCAVDGVDSPREIEHALLDSVRVYLVELRAMDHEIGEAVMADTVSSQRIVPLIARRFRPTVSQLRVRMTALDTTDAVGPLRRHFLQYLSTRLEAYDAAIAGLAQDRPELYNVFSRKQAEADRLGRDLQSEIREVRQRVGHR
ncbi:hypothetical protein ACFL6X_02935 [Candidatus Latescibacterota bacterium]